MDETFARDDENTTLRLEEDPDTERNEQAQAGDGMPPAPASHDIMEMAGGAPLSWTVDH